MLEQLFSKQIANNESLHDFRIRYMSLFTMQYPYIKYKVMKVSRLCKTGYIKNTNNENLFSLSTLSLWSSMFIA